MNRYRIQVFENGEWKTVCFVNGYKKAQETVKNLFAKGYQIKWFYDPKI